MYPQAYTQATSVDAGRWYSWTQSGSIELSLGATAEAVAKFIRALETKSDNLAALLGLADALLISARRHISQGALGRPALVR